MSEQDDLDRPDEMCEPFHQQYDETIALAKAQFEQATFSEKQEYDRIKAAAWEVYQQAKTRATTEDEVKMAFATYKQVADAVTQHYLAVTDSARGRQRKAYEDAAIKLNEAIAGATQQWQQERGTGNEQSTEPTCKIVVDGKECGKPAQFRAGMSIVGGEFTIPVCEAHCPEIITTIGLE